ncbi:MAG TPA: c-type cytochrome [Ohtaekwangia sp.]
MKKLIPITVLAFMIACAPDKPKQEAEVEPYEANHESENAVSEASGDPTKGIGQVTEVKLQTPLEQERIGRGKAIYEMKCQACHRLDETRIVGPGWKDVTKRRQPEWIMNMITNVDVMLDKDAEAQKLLELCLTRMPNQNVSIGDARDVLEFMRQNDGEK